MKRVCKLICTNTDRQSPGSIQPSKISLSGMKSKRYFEKSTLFALLLVCLLSVQNLWGQGRQKIAVVGIDVKGLSIDKETVRNMVLLELEKADKYEVMDKYDVADVLRRNDFDSDGCYGKNCQVRVGQMLNADKMLTGSVEKFGSKIIFIMRLVDVRTESVEKTDVMEYLDQPDYLSVMLRMSMNNILGVENDRHLVDLLVNYDQPITSLRTTLALDGPRVGVTYFWGSYATRMQAPESEGGFNMYPASVLIGYQFEKRFLSAGDFQALFEFIPSIVGMESGMIIPSLSTMLGFRFSQSGFEFGLGPVLRGVRLADGFYDDNGKWHILSDVEDNLNPGYPVVRTLDSRGSFSASYGMIFAVGKTFRSGYLNMPVNIYYSPRKEGSVLGLTLGFNVANRPKFAR